MKVIVEYDPDLRRKPSYGYTEAMLRKAAVTIEKQFRKAAHAVYLRVLERPLPDFMKIEVRPDSMMGGKLGANTSIAACCLLRVGDDEALRFFLNESYTKGVLKGEAPSKRFAVTVMHEMMHSVDAIVIGKSSSVLVDLEMEFSFGALNDNERCRNRGLHLVLSMFGQFREEGLAMLGACLLTRCRFNAAFDDWHVFRRIFVRAMRQATKPKWEKDDNEFEEWLETKTYEIAPDILVLVLAARGTIDSATEKKILHGFKTGDYDLTDKEISCIMKAAVTLSLPEYVEGLLTPNQTGQTIGYLTEFFNYCGWYQKNVREEAIKAFCELMSQSSCSVRAFNETMHTVLEKPFVERTLDKKCKAYFSHPFGQDLYHNLLEQVKKLHTVMKTSNNAEKRLAAQLGLTYLFSGKGLVDNDIPILGRVDDLLVINKTLKVVEGLSLEAFARNLISMEKQ